MNKCAPIYNLAIKGDWKEAKTMLAKDRRLATAAISQGWATLPPKRYIIHPDNCMHMRHFQMPFMDN